MLTSSNANRNTSFFTTFYTDPRIYDVCKEKLCFLILPNPPVIFSTKKLENSPAYPFACNILQREKEQPRLRGVFFNALDRMSAKQDSNSPLKEVMCVYGESTFSLAAAHKNIFGPFDAGAWTVMCSLAGCFIVCILLYVLIFSPSRRPLEAITWLLIGEKNGTQEEGQVFEITSWRALMLSLFRRGSSFV